MLRRAVELGTDSHLLRISHCHLRTYEARMAKAKG
jgi:hypothetical protein